MSDFAAACTILDDGVRGGAFAAAAVEAGRSTGPVWQAAFGRAGTADDAPSTSVDTVFDLASLTKVIATTTLAMRAVDEHRIDLDAPVGPAVSRTGGGRIASVRYHRRICSRTQSGLTAHLPFLPRPPRKTGLRIRHRRAAAGVHRRGPTSIYSDLGFILLGFILEDALEAGLDAAFDRVVEQCGWGELRFRPPRAWRDRTAPTEFDAWRGRVLQGEVHDENAWALGGVAGHAGLFGTAAAVGRFARTVAAGFRDEPTIAASATFGRFMTRTPVPGSSRALGWDTMLPTSSCGRRMSGRAVGHTGFTGTSLWIDPAADAYVVLLTNRVYPTRTNEAILSIRPALHDAVMEELA